MKTLNNRTAFVTGGASGIGLGIAKALASEGANVAIADVQADRLASALFELRSITSSVMTLEVDVRDKASLEDASSRIESELGPVSILCNNAGIGGGGKVLDTAEESWKNVIDINFWGVLNGIQVFLPGMLERGGPGHIVNTASFSGIQGHGHQSAYGSSKFAVVGLSEFLRNDLAETGVGVSVLCPHVVDTPILDGLRQRASKQVLSLIDGMAVSPDIVGQQVVSAMEQDELYIFCDGVQTREMLTKRCETLLAAMDRQFPPAGE